MNIWQPTTKSLLDRLEKLAMNPWNCSICGEAFIGARPSSTVCQGCEEIRKEALNRGLSKEQALKRSGTPLRHRQEFEWLDQAWPRDPRPKASSLDPLKWPTLFTDHPETPPLVTFCGCNGSGKSARAAHLLYLLHTRGVRPLLWITEAELAEERGRFGPWVRYSQAQDAGALVLDELGSTRGRKSDIETALGISLPLIDKRLMNRKPTVITTHRPLSRAGAEKRGQPESESVEKVAPAIFDRMKEGLILNLPARSHRGAWAFEDGALPSQEEV